MTASELITETGTTRKVRRIPIVINGATGEIGQHTHLRGALEPIRSAGGVELTDGTRLLPEPILVGRNADKVRAVAERHGLDKWTTSLDEALANAEVYFDCQATGARPDAIRTAIAAGMDVFTEKPLAATLGEAQDLWRQAEAAGIRHGIVHDKLFLPGMTKLRRVLDSGLCGRILHLRLDFGYWIFDGETLPPQRSSWNYRSPGGGMVSDMYSHWRYLIEGLAGPITDIHAVATTTIPVRYEAGHPYDVTVEDGAYALLTLRNGATATVSSSWSNRPYREDLLEVQIDGATGSAVAGTQECRIQPAVATDDHPWAPVEVDRHRLRRSWQKVADYAVSNEPYRRCWEAFLRHVADEQTYIDDFGAGVRDAEFVDLTLRAAQSGHRQTMPDPHRAPDRGSAHGAE